MFKRHQNICYHVHCRFEAGNSLCCLPQKCSRNIQYTSVYNISREPCSTQKIIMFPLPKRGFTYKRLAITWMQLLDECLRINSPVMIKNKSKNQWTSNHLISNFQTWNIGKISIGTDLNRYHNTGSLIRASSAKFLAIQDIHQTKAFIGPGIVLDTFLARQAWMASKGSIMKWLVD